MTSIDLIQRRLIVYEMWSLRKMSPKRIMQILETRDIHVSLRTIQDDIKTIYDWLPEIMGIKESEERVTSELVATLRVTQSRALNLAETADNDNAKVGALRATGEAVSREADIRLKTGLLRAAPIQLELKQEISGFDEAKISRYIGTVVAVALEQETRDTDEEDDKADNTESVDTQPPPS